MARALIFSCILAAACAAGGAQAQQADAAQTAAPWYERFTFGAEAGDGPARWVPRAERRTTVPLSARSRWGLSLDLANESARRPLGVDARQMSAGAYYQLSPRVRVGGAVDVNARTPAAETEREPKSNPGVRFESAFRF